MNSFIDLITQELKDAFRGAGYDDEKIKASVSNRPDLCEYQCNGALSLAKSVKKPPMEIANEISEALKGNPAFESAQAAKPGFINLKISGSFLSSYVGRMAKAERYGLDTGKPLKIIIDYGGPNVAKPLHIGHLRSAIIGESVKRICRYMGHDVTGDIHMGDWGLQMGQIIAELRERKPDLPYFDDSFRGEYPKEAPFTLSELEEIYPAASAKCKEASEAYDPAFYEKAKDATAQLQKGRKGFMAIWRHVVDISVADLRKNYERLDVHFDLWNGESTVQGLIAPMLEKMRESGFLKQSEGALVVDIKEDSDKKELPPCIIIKSDGATLYSTTDLATLMMREEDFHPDRVIYVVDKRQELHFTQVFRTAKKTGLVPESTALTFLGFGTMNGADGKPYKTRSGGVMRLEALINETTDAVRAKMKESGEKAENVSNAEADCEGISGKDSGAAAGADANEETCRMIALSALKYGDLSNQASKDYIFDIARFIEFEGNTGPYILYTIVRIKSILRKYRQENSAESCGLSEKDVLEDTEKDLMLALSGFGEMMRSAYEELAPHKICAFVYNLSERFNRFYHEVRILTEKDDKKRESYIALLSLTERVLETCIDILGFSAPDKM